MYKKRVQKLHVSLGISQEYLEHPKQPLCFEPTQLVNTEPDYYGRHQRLTPEAFEAWSNMKQSAGNDGVTVFIISAFRDAQYQHDLIARKIGEGRSLEQILRVNAAPGFSEHHTGRAVDLGTHDCKALDEEFEQTDAFAWLQRNAKSYRFSMSYPRGNAAGFAYEPWHWCFQSSG